MRRRVIDHRSARFGVPEAGVAHVCIPGKRCRHSKGPRVAGCEIGTYVFNCIRSTCDPALIGLRIAFRARTGVRSSRRGTRRTAVTSRAPAAGPGQCARRPGPRHCLGLNTRRLGGVAVARSQRPRHLGSRHSAYTWPHAISRSSSGIARPYTDPHGGPTSHLQAHRRISPPAPKGPYSTPCCRSGIRAPRCYAACSIHPTCRAPSTESPRIWGTQLSSLASTASSLAFTASSRLALAGFAGSPGPEATKRERASQPTPALVIDGVPSHLTREVFTPHERRQSHE